MSAPRITLDINLLVSAGVTLLLSEDFSGESVLGGVHIVNPLVHKDLPGLLGLKS